MTSANYKHIPIDNIPDCKGKQVYLKIMNSPKVDLERLQKESEEFEKELLEERRSQGYKVD